MNYGPCARNVIIHALNVTVPRVTLSGAVLCMSLESSIHPGTGQVVLFALLRIEMDKYWSFGGGFCYHYSMQLHLLMVEER